MQDGFREAAMRFLRYDPDTGVFIWKVRCGRMRAGTRAGTARPDGYRKVRVAGKQCRENRLAWLFMTGEWPPPGYEVDHINREPGNNRWTNLRLALPSQNTANRISKRTTSGHVGIYIHPNGRFYPYLQLNNRLHKFGGYKTLEEAVAVRIEAQQRFFGEFAPQTEHTPPMEASIVILAAPRPIQQELLI